MSALQVTHLLTYPIKSTKGWAVQTSQVNELGLMYDRVFALLNEDNTILTARENPALLKIAATLDNETLTLRSVEKGAQQVALAEMNEGEEAKVTLFNQEVNAKKIDTKIDEWLSDIIGESARLVVIDDERLRHMKAKHNGQAGDQIAFSDAAPIHLLTQASVDHLNGLLDDPVSIHNFRPNIVVTGSEPYEEDTWKTVRIGDCVFEVVVQTSRCGFTTIDPATLERNPQHEPLKTLATFRLQERKINFGIYLVPRQLGTIQVDDKVAIEYR